MTQLDTALLLIVALAAVIVWQFRTIRRQRRTIHRLQNALDLSRAYVNHRNADRHRQAAYPYP